jgi:hypothetical protein
VTRVSTMNIEIARGTAMLGACRRFSPAAGTLLTRDRSVRGGHADAGVRPPGVNSLRLAGNFQHEWETNNDVSSPNADQVQRRQNHFPAGSSGL